MERNSFEYNNPSNGYNVTIEAKKIIENADIPSDVFELPLDVEVKE